MESLVKFSDPDRHSEIEKYFNRDDMIQIIDKKGPLGSINLRFTKCYIKNRIVSVVVTDSAYESLYDISDESSANLPSRVNNINKLLQESYNLFNFSNDPHDYDNIEWSLFGDNLIEMRRRFREQIDLYKTYDNQHHLVTKLLLEVIEYYLNKYLIEEEKFSSKETEKLVLYFKQAIAEQNYLKYFIRAYTLTNNFHYLLNKHLALYILDYFDISSFSSSPSNYRLINCLVHIVTLLINHPDIYKYAYKGTTYRGLLMTENELNKYRNGNCVLNRSFLSTSKRRSVARVFSGVSQQHLANIPVFLKYTIKQNRTAIDIEHLSIVKDEKEVLILPFSVFRVKNDPKTSSHALVKIDLEECEDEGSRNNPGPPCPRLPPRQSQTGKPGYATQSICSRIGIALLIIFTLFGTVGLYRAIRYNKNLTSVNPNLINGTCPLILNRTVWNATKPKSYTPLVLPVPYVAIHHTASSECSTRATCVFKLQYWQKFHMEAKEWDDIAYNFLIAGNGDVFEGRGWNYLGAHCRFFNNESIGIAFIGDMSVAPPSKLSIETMHSLINCGVARGFIKKNYTIVGPEGNIAADIYTSYLGASHPLTHRCSKNKTRILHLIEEFRQRRFLVRLHLIIYARKNLFEKDAAKWCIHHTAVVSVYLGLLRLTIAG